MSLTSNSVGSSRKTQIWDSSSLEYLVPRLTPLGVGVLLFHFRSFPGFQLAPVLMTLKGGDLSMHCHRLVLSCCRHADNLVWKLCLWDLHGLLDL